MTRLRRTVVALLVITLPLTLTLLLYPAYLGLSLTQDAPLDSDEVLYWQEIATFRAVGFNSGYFAFGEIEPPADFTRYGAHGFVHALMLGLLARFTGWETYTMPLVNLGLLCGGLAVFWAVARPRGVQIGLVAALVVLFWPISQWAMTAMQESLHHAFAFIIAALFYAAFQRPTDRRIQALLFGVVLLAALVRALWAFLFVPLFVALVFPRQRVLALIAAGVCIAATFAFFRWTGSPYPTNFLNIWLDVLRRDPAQAVGALIYRIGYNIFELDNGATLEVFQRGQVIVLLVLCGVALGLRPRGRRSAQTLTQGEAWFHLVNVGLLFAFNLVFYDIYAWRDQRTIAPHLLVSLLLLIMAGKTLVSGVLIGSGLLVIGAFFGTYRDFNVPPPSAESRAAFAQAIDGVIVYQPDADPWCNTILMTGYPPELVALPPGIGITSVLGVKRTSGPLRSRYVLLSDFDRAALADRLRLEPLAETTLGTLYRNLNTPCPQDVR